MHNLSRRGEYLGQVREVSELFAGAPRGVQLISVTLHRSTAYRDAAEVAVQSATWWPTPDRSGRKSAKSSKSSRQHHSLG